MFAPDYSLQTSEYFLGYIWFGIKFSQASLRRQGIGRGLQLIRSWSQSTESRHFFFYQYTTAYTCTSCSFPSLPQGPQTFYWIMVLFHHLAVDTKSFSYGVLYNSVEQGTAGDAVWQCAVQVVGSKVAGDIDSSSWKCIALKIHNRWCSLLLLSACRFSLLIKSCVVPW